MAKDSIDQTTDTTMDETEGTPSGEATVENEELAVETIPEVRESAASGGDSTAEPIVVQGDAEQPGGRREIVKSAMLVSLGNFGSSLMGLFRQSAVGATGLAGPFFAALKPAQTFYDFMINGSTSGALIPTFNDYAAVENREELRRLVYTLVNLVMIISLLASIGFFFIAPWFVGSVLVGGFPPDDKLLAVQFSQIIFFSLVALSPFSVLLSALYALKEFGWPAFATAAYHVGIIIGAFFSAWFGVEHFGRYGLAFGVLVGAAGEIVLLLPGILKQKLYYMLVLDLHHPALRRILKLYAPVAFSFLVSMAVIFLDLYLQSSTPCVSSIMPNIDVAHCHDANVGALGLATTLIQFPIGLVAMALQFAVLPTLSTLARQQEHERFKETLLIGFRLGLLLMIPAAAGLIVLRGPITTTIFQHGKHSPQDTALVALALQNYAYQLPFVAMDQLLIAAFYARKNTIVPVTVGFVCILGYLAVALPFNQSWGMPAMAFANTVQNSLHAIILLVLLRMAIGSLHVRKMLPAVGKILVSTVVLVAVAWGLQKLLVHAPVFSADTFIGHLSTLVVAGGLAAVAYFGFVYLLKVEEINLLKGAVLAKLGRK